MLSPSECRALWEELGDSGLTHRFGTTRQVPFGHVTEFLRSPAERGEDLYPLHSFLNGQFRPVSWPSPRLRFKPGQAVWVASHPREWVRATVLETNAPPVCKTGGIAFLHAAAYTVGGDTQLR